MNGDDAEIRNQRKNELPLIRPTMPPARPKKKRDDEVGHGAGVAA